MTDEIKLQLRQLALGLARQDMTWPFWPTSETAILRRAERYYEWLTAASTNAS